MRCDCGYRFKEIYVPESGGDRVASLRHEDPTFYLISIDRSLIVIRRVLLGFVVGSALLVLTWFVASMFMDAFHRENERQTPPPIDSHRTPGVPDKNNH